jgi:hypothetical protein
MRTGGPRTQQCTQQCTQPAHPARAPLLRIFQGRTHFGSRDSWVRGPVARMISSFTAPFNFKVALCRGHADRRSAHPAHILLLRIFQGRTHFGSRDSWVRGPAARMISSFAAPFNLKVALYRDMRTGGPRTQQCTQPAHPAHTLSPHTQPAHTGSLAPLLKIPFNFTNSARAITMSIYAVA